MKKKSKKSILKRIRITKTGKVVRRAMGLGHSRANKSSTQMGRKANNRTLGAHTRILKHHLS